MPRFLNIACGNTYVASAEWENIDYAPHDYFVRQADILGGLKTSEAKYQVIYCAHFIEHVPRKNVRAFLARCKSMMTEESLLRIVTPDAELLLREYLTHKDAGNPTLSEFAFLNFLDQCVRQEGGGELARRYAQIASTGPDELRAYAEHLNGADVSATLRDTRDSRAARLAEAIRRPMLLFGKLEPFYVRLVCAFLPKAFREQNVSFTPVGEKHQWMYDFDSLKAELNNAGFGRVERRTFNTSLRTDGLFAPLDEINGKPRKGNHQLFVEAQI